MRYYLLLATLMFSSLFALAQGQQKQGSFIDEPALKEFNASANTHHDNLLLQALWYEAPYPGYYQYLRLDKDGNALTCQVVPDWAMQALSSGKLSAEQLERVKSMLSNSSLKPDAPPLKIEKGERHTAFVFLNGDDYVRYDYVGSPPPEAQEVLSFVKAEVVAQWKERMRQWREKQWKTQP